MALALARLGVLPTEILRLASTAQSLTCKQVRLSSTSNLPRVAQPSLWQSLVPKFLRHPRKESQTTEGRQSRGWNPATPILILGVLVGSQAIHLINLKNGIVTFSRQTDARIAQLREVIERVQAGEDVDVEKVLGTGDPRSEAEWEAVMKDIETGDNLWQEKRWKAKRRARKADAAAAAEKDTVDGESVKVDGSSTTLRQHNTRPEFY